MMLARLKVLFTAPAFPGDDEKTRRARVLSMLLLTATLFIGFLSLIAIPLIFVEKLYNSIAVLCLIVVLGVAFWLMRRGQVRLASILFSFGTWPIISFVVLFTGGVRSEIVVFYAAAAAGAGILLGKQGARLMVAITLLATWGMALLTMIGKMPPPVFPIPPLAAWLDLTLALLLVMVAVNIDTGSLDEALKLTRQRLDELRRAEQSDALQVQRLRTLRGIEDAVLSSADLSEILPLLVKEVANQLHVDAVDLLFFSPEKQTLDFAAGEGFRTEALRYTRLEMGTGLAGKAAQERQTVYIPDLSAFEDNPVLLRSIAGEGFVTYYGVPLIAKGQLHGVLELFHRSMLAPDPDWVTFLQALAAQAAISIDNARLLETTQQSLAETNALYRISQSMAASLDAEQLIRDVVELLQKDFGFYHVQIYGYDPVANVLDVGSGSGAVGAQLKKQNYSLQLGTGIVGRSAESGQPFMAYDVDQVDFFVRNPLLPYTQSEMAIPIKVEGQVLGVLDVQQALPGRLTLRQMKLMEAVADQLAVALQKANLYTNLQRSLRQEKAMRAQLIQSERLVLVGRLLASVSHELNNPIQAIQNALFLIQEGEQLSPQGHQDLAIVLSETERMSALINRLRATYRGTHSESYQEIQMNTVVEDVRALTTTHMRRQEIRFECVPDPDLPPVLGIPDQMRQVILNLFMNAIEAMPSGGCLSVRTQSLPAQKKVLVAFSDTGTGIDPEILPHIFEPFVSNKENGTGLGLTITFDILQQHGGELKARNNEHGGATLEILLPAGGRA